MEVIVEHAHAGHDVNQTGSPCSGCCHCRHPGFAGSPETWLCASFCDKCACWCLPDVPKGGWSGRPVLLAPSCTAAPVCCCSTCEGAVMSWDSNKSQPSLRPYAKCWSGVEQACIRRAVEPDCIRHATSAQISACGAWTPTWKHKAITAYL